MKRILLLLITFTVFCSNTKCFSNKLHQVKKLEIGNSILATCMLYSICENIRVLPKLILIKYDLPDIQFSLYKHQRTAQPEFHNIRFLFKANNLLNFGERYFLVDAANKDYLYHKGQTLKMLVHTKKKVSNHKLILWIIFGFVSFIYALMLVYWKRSDEISMLNRKLFFEEEKIKKLRKDVIEKENSVNYLTVKLNQKQEENVFLFGKIEHYKKACEEKMQLLEVRTEQTKSLINILHKSEFKGKAQDVIDVIRKASNGKYQMSDKDWNIFYNAVDKLYPSFKNVLVQKSGKLDEQELQIGYLIRIGLNNTQIQNITDLPRTTVWRWTKKFDWILMKI